MTLFGVTAAVAWLHLSGVPLGTLEFYHDRKDSTAEHRAVFEAILRRDLPQIAKEAAAAQPAIFATDVAGLRFTTVTGVDKPDDGVSCDPFQRGTDLAHHLCR